MDLIWQEARHLFAENDGSLPEICFRALSDLSVEKVYLFLQQNSKFLESTAAYYWSVSKQTETPIFYGENPAAAVTIGDAESFHVVFGGITSPAGKTIPPLGVFISSKQLCLDYRMGADWNESAIVGLFELLDEVANLCGETTFEHTENINDDGEKLVSIWHKWRRAHDAY